MKSSSKVFHVYDKVGAFLLLLQYYFLIFNFLFERRYKNTLTHIFIISRNLLLARKTLVLPVVIFLLVCYKYTLQEIWMLNKLESEWVHVAVFVVVHRAVAHIQKAVKNENFFPRNCKVLLLQSPLLLSYFSWRNPSNRRSKRKLLESV